jgi:protein ImuB
MYAALHFPRPIARESLLTLAREFSPRVESESDERTVVLDLAGLGRQWPQVSVLAEALQSAAAARGLSPVHVALAPTRLGARLVAQERAGIHVVDASALATIVAPLPLERLDLPEEARETFRRWGVRTLGQLAGLPASGLITRFGAVALRWQRSARGEDDRPLTPESAPEPLSVRLELEWPIDGLEPLAFVLGPLLETLAATLVRREQRAAALCLELALGNGRTTTRALRTAVPTREARTWRTLLLLELESNPPPDAIEALTVTATPTEARATQFSLLELAAPSPERLSETMARLSDWTRDGRAGSPVLLPTHRPGAFLMSRFDGAAGVAVPPPSDLRVALRVYRPPRPIEVSLDNGVPAAVRGSGLRGEVVSGAGPWRASGDWWDGTWSREEWDVELRPGGLFRIFRDLPRNAWFVEGELD